CRRSCIAPDNTREYWLLPPRQRAEHPLHAACTIGHGVRTKKHSHNSSSARAPPIVPFSRKHLHSEYCCSNASADPEASAILRPATISCERPSVATGSTC